MREDLKHHDIDSSEIYRGSSSAKSGFASFIFGAALGAGLMYILDPDRGRDRRSFLRDQASNRWQDVSKYASRAKSEVSSRARTGGHRGESFVENVERGDSQRSSIPGTEK
jgi:hypothetical protein